MKNMFWISNEEKSFPEEFLQIIILKIKVENIF